MELGFLYSLCIYNQLSLIHYFLELHKGDEQFIVRYGNQNTHLAYSTISGAMSVEQKLDFSCILLSMLFNQEVSTARTEMTQRITPVLYPLPSSTW